MSVSPQSNSDPRPYQIQYEDPHLIVVSKSAGLLSQGDIGGEPSLVDLLRQYFGRHYVGLVHRLDRNTSGLMVVAKRTKAAQRLTESLQEGTLVRRYLAWVWGALPQSVTWEHQLLKDSSTNTVRVVSSGGKRAKLSARPIRSAVWPAGSQNTCTLVEFVLETGRSHQIRVQSSQERYPLLGDPKYSSGRARAPFRRLALHSAWLAFPHPMSHEQVQFESPLPADLRF